MRLRPPFPISRVLPAIVSLLIVGAVVPVIIATYLINRQNADALLSARAELLVDGLENQLTGLLGPVATQFETARDHIEGVGLLDDTPDALEHVVEGILIGAPQLAGMGIIRPDGTMRRWEAGQADAIEEPRAALPFVDDAFVATRNHDGTQWAAPFVSLVLGDVILNPRIRLDFPDGMLGILAGGVTGAQLSQYVAELSSETLTAFVLYDRTGLIAYPGRVTETQVPTSPALPTLSDSGNPVLRDMWKDQNPLSQTGKMSNTSGHWARINGIPYAYFYREVSGYGPENLLIGVAVPSSESWLFRWAAAISAGVGASFLILALLIGNYIARRMARPFVELDGALGKLQTMQFDDVSLPNMQRSQIAELATSAERLKHAARALSRINQYVPRTLAQRLMHGSEDASRASEREVTVMFIDLEGLSHFARRRSAAETAEWLNTLFGCIGPLIEARGGVIDKYTGDGLMAFWGAPDAQSDQVQRALQAACDIHDLMNGSSRPLGQGTHPRLRIGLHHGPAIVGNLGFTGRVNYTLIGETVNMAERTEQSLKGHCPKERAIIGVSKSMWEVHGPSRNIEVLKDVNSEQGPVVVVRPMRSSGRP